jgi:hypothetical protein
MYNDVDWLETDTYADIKQEQEYLAVKCNQPHKNGSVCIPEWDGYGYVCVDRILSK